MVTSKCKCGRYDINPDNCLTEFNSDDVAVEQHTVSTCRV